MNPIHHIIACSFVLTATLGASAQTASEQSPAARWAPWMGCWQIAEESIQGEVGATPGARVCVAPSPEGGATMTTLVKDKPVRVETVVADGSQRPLTEPDCRGWQRAEWSQLSARVYARAEVTCGDQPKRTVSGMAAIVGPTWLDIQMIESEGRKTMRVRRYRRAPEQAGAQSPARELITVPLSGKLSIADIKEAAAKLPPEALQAAIIELAGDGYDLNAKRLLELDAAGIPDSVIDLMVAMSFPKRFVVERAVPRSGYGSGGFDDPYSGGFGSQGLWGFQMWPYYAHPMFYSSYYSPFGYGYWGYYDPYYYGGHGVAVINPGGSGGSVSPVEPSGNGRVVDGLGYTRIRRNQPAVPPRDGSSGGSSTTSATGSGSSGSGSGGVSTGGYSGGGASGGERTAVPRPPGGN